VAPAVDVTSDKVRGHLKRVRQERADRMRASLATFIHGGDPEGDGQDGAWGVLHSASLDWNWHHDVICETLERVTAGDIKRLYINCPPGAMKSLLVNVFWPAWEWASNPSTQWADATHDGQLSKRDCMRTRDLVQSAWYNRYFGWNQKTDLNGKTHFGNEEQGFFVRTSVGAGFTGHRVDRLNGDDLLDVEDAFSRTKRKGTIDWLKNKYLDRTNDDDSTVVIIGQRVHTADHFDWLEDVAGFESLVLEDPYDPDFNPSTVEFEDPRNEAGQYLHPSRHGPEYHAQQRRYKGPSVYSAHMSQKPVQDEGEMLKGDWLQYRYTTYPMFSGPDRELIWVCDPKGGSTRAGSSEACIQLWLGLKRNEDAEHFERACLLRERRGIWDQPDTLRVCRNLYQDRLWGSADRFLVEDKADGPAIKAHLRDEFSFPIELVSPGGRDKEQRVRDVTGFWEAGNVWLPTKELEPWVVDFIDQHVTFPRGARDDRVDTSTYAVSYFFLDMDDDNGDDSNYLEDYYA